MDQQEFMAGLRAAISAQLQPGEQCLGVAIANDQRVFSATIYAVGVTDRRLVMQRLTRRMEPDGAAASIEPAQLASASVDGVSGASMEASAMVADMAAVTVKLKTHDGRKHKLMMMGGEGPLVGMLAGRDQQDGVVALLDWLGRFGPR